MTSLFASRRPETSPSANLVTIVAPMAIRQTIRHFLRLSHYVLAIRIPDLADVYVYEMAARALLDPQGLMDEDGKLAVLVTQASSIKESGWDLARRFNRTNRALLFYVDETDISESLALMIDHRIELQLPKPKHFEAAAKTLGQTISCDEAAYLATRDLRDLRLALRPKRPIRKVVHHLKRAVPGETQPNVEPSERGTPRLEDMAGFGPAKAWGLQLAADIKAWMSGEIEWADVDKGIVLAGPSGTGKTTFAKALANSCGVTLVTSSAAAWQSTGHLGDMLKAMRKTFKEAAAVRPSALLIDEVDSVGDREAYKNSDYHDYKRQVVNGLLECMDSTEGREGVIVVGTTNDASAIDAALLRPGRFEQVVQIERPDAEDRKAILRYHLPDLVVQDFGPFVAQSEAWSGADIEKLARDARRMARRSGRKSVTDDDLLGAMPTLSAYTEEERYRLAIHEIGHAVVGAMLRPDQLVNVKIDRWRPLRSGWNTIGVTIFNDKPPLMASESYFTNTIAILLSGMAAERIFFGEHSMASGGDAEADLTRASDLATMMERCFAFGHGLLTDIGVGRRPMESLRQNDPDLREVVRQRLDAQFERVMQILTSRRVEVQDLAERLSDCFELNAEDIHRALGARVGEMEAER